MGFRVQGFGLVAESLLFVISGAEAAFCLVFALFWVCYTKALINVKPDMRDSATLKPNSKKPSTPKLHPLPYTLKFPHRNPDLPKPTEALNPKSPDTAAGLPSRPRSV